MLKVSLYCVPEYSMLAHRLLTKYCSGDQNIIQVIKSRRRMRWVGHIAHMGERRGVYRVLVRNLGERDHLQDQDINGIKILILIFRTWDGGGDGLDGSGSG